MPYRQEVTDAVRILQGTAGRPVHHDEVRAAGKIVVADRQRLLLVAVWSRRLLEATDDAATAKARARLAEALDA